jgi:hypothetical protein
MPAAGPGERMEQHAELMAAPRWMPMVSYYPLMHWPPAQLGQQEAVLAAAFLRPAALRGATGQGKRGVWCLRPGSSDNTENRRLHIVHRHNAKPLPPAAAAWLAHT